jgi:hypothetical protein
MRRALRYALTGVALAAALPFGYLVGLTLKAMIGF